MAHDLKPNRTREGLALALLALALPAAAQTLGDLEVRSAPGEPLDATVALGSANGAPVTPECLFLSRGAAEDGPFVTRAQVAVFEEGGERFARLRSEKAVENRNTRLRIVVRCPGQPHVAYREYRDLFEPRAASSPAAPTASVPVAPVAAGEGTGLQVRNGDSMASLAALLLPRNTAAQRAYVQALREANPSIAGLGTTDPIPLDANVVLPDLRSLPRVKAEPSIAAAPAPTTPPERPARAAPPKPAPASKAASAPKPAPAPKLAAAPAPPSPAEPAPPSAAPAKAAPKAPASPAAAWPRRPATEGGERMVLRLSSPEVDLSRSRNIDDAARAKLRERLLVLDNDDQVAALLSLRDSLKRLEGRVAELQLKLSALPAPTPPAVPQAPAPAVAKAPPPPTVETPAPKVEVAPPKIEAPPPKIEAPPPKIETPKAEAPPPVKAEAAPPKAEAPAAPRPEPPKVEAASKPAPKAKPAKPAEPVEEGVAMWIWGALAAAALALGALAWWWLRREPSEEDLPEIQPADSEPPPATEPPQGDREFDVAEPVAPAIASAARREIDSDATLATEVRGSDPAALRQRYMEERFPEIASRAIVLSDPDSVIKAARLLYEDGAVPRAVELLQLASEEHPQEQRTWLALFEVYRLERMAEPFADLARRFRDLHGKGENWRKVQFFGREVDPGNTLYRDIAVGIETIKFEAGKPPAPETFDPISENWLNAPMDFENELLAVELRRALMEAAHVTDDDLTPNPMPALRSVEMFTVA